MSGRSRYQKDNANPQATPIVCLRVRTVSPRRGCHRPQRKSEFFPIWESKRQGALPAVQPGLAADRTVTTSNLANLGITGPNGLPAPCGVRDVAANPEEHLRRGRFGSNSWTYRIPQQAFETPTRQVQAKATFVRLKFWSSSCRVTKRRLDVIDSGDREP